MRKLFLCALGALTLASLGCTDNPFPYSYSADHDVFYITPGEYRSVPINFTPDTNTLSKCASCDDYRRSLLDAAARNFADNRFSYNYYHSPDTGKSWGFADDVAYAEVPSASTPPEYTTTNTQEAGIDEMDLTKNDSKTIYHVSLNGSVVISAIWPVKSARYLTTIAPLEGNPDQTRLLLEGDRLLVLDSIEKQKKTFVRVYDVKDPASPKLLKQHEIDGELSDARMVDHNAVLVLKYAQMNIFNDLSKHYRDDIPGIPAYNDISWGDNYSNAKRNHYIKEYLPIIRGWVEDNFSDKLDMLKRPQYSDGKAKRDLIGCADIFDAGSGNIQQTLVIAVELSGSDFAQVSASALSDSTGLAYASDKNLFIIADVTSNNAYDSEYSSLVYQFKLGKGKEPIEFAHAIPVTGMISNPFFLSEYQDHLRVVSQYRYDGASLSIYDLSTDHTPRVGKVDNFAYNENIYAVRFSEDRGYVVTFRQTDPLFTFDLSDPTHPVKAGELQIPGYSTYIHPIDRDHLLTFGIAGDEWGNLGTPQLQIFDVSNLRKPTRTHALAIDWDNHYLDLEDPAAHRYISFHPASGLLAFPAVNPPENTIEVYRVNVETGITALGSVSHATFCDDNCRGDLAHYTPYTSRFYFSSSSSYERGAYLFTLSEAGMKINDANKPEEEFKSIAFPGAH